MQTRIEVRIPRSLQDYASLTEDVVISARTVRAALAELARCYPSLYVGICDETGSVRRHIHLFVNSDFIHTRDGLDTPLLPGDEFSIWTAVSGG